MNLKWIIIPMMIMLMIAPALASNGDTGIELKWKTSSLDLGITMNAEPVLQDVTGDGIQEIFIAGKQWPDYQTNPGNPILNLICVDGGTGSVLWRVEFSSNYSSSNNDHWPCMVYDFDKDGEFEVIVSSGFYETAMYDARTGDIVWQNPHVGTGWHNQGFIDKGDVVYLYLIEAGYGSSFPWSVGGLQKVYASNGTVIKQVDHKYECWGGVSIADIDNDSVYEILITDRGGNSGYYRGVACYDEDLNYEWHDPSNTYSTQCPMIADVDDDGELEVILGSQGGSNSGRIRIYSGDGTVEHTSSMYIGFHHQCAIGDVDGDGNLELVSTKNNNKPKIYDLKLHILDESALGSEATLGPDIMDVIDDAEGLPEILHTGDTGAVHSAKIYRYDPFEGNYEIVHEFPHRVFWSVASDIDDDGLKEILMGRTASWDKSNSNFMWCYETDMTASDPAPITNVAFGGLRRLNNDIYYEPAGYIEPEEPPEEPEDPMTDTGAMIVLIMAIIAALSAYLAYLEGKKKNGGS